jgi:hypothetical protein
MSEKITMTIEQLTEVYNAGYQEGHNGTVEGCFVDVHWSDKGTYNRDVVCELLAEMDNPSETPLQKAYREVAEAAAAYHPGNPDSEKAWDAALKGAKSREWTLHPSMLMSDLEFLCREVMERRERERYCIWTPDKPVRGEPTYMRGCVSGQHVDHLGEPTEQCMFCRRPIKVRGSDSL